MLYTRFPQLPKYLCMDNGCNLHHYMMNREPEHFRDLHMYVDELHFKGHTHCCPAYNTGATGVVLLLLLYAHHVTRPCCRGVPSYQEFAIGRAEEQRHPSARASNLLYEADHLHVVHAILPVPHE